MKFGTLTAILTFCAGATFTLVDIGTDVALAYEYWNGSYFVRPYLLCNETSNGLCPVHNSPYAILTTVWIGLGGSIQFLLVAYFLQRGDDRLDWLPEVAFLVTDNRVFNGPLGRSLRSFARTYNSAYSLRSAPQHSAAFRFFALASLVRSIHGLAQSLHLLPRGIVEILK